MVRDNGEGVAVPRGGHDGQAARAGRIIGLQASGFTERQARFLVLVLEHSGVCLPRQVPGRVPASRTAGRRTGFSSSSSPAVSRQPTCRRRRTRGASTTCSTSPGTRRSVSPITGTHPYIWLDATYHKVRVDGRVVSQATVVAIGVTGEGDRQILGIDVGASEERSFWTAFLRSLVKRGLAGVQLVISDAHEGLKQAIKTVLGGVAWQRCRVHFMRNLLARVPHSLREPVAAIVRTIFAQPDHASALGQLQKVADGLRKRLPAAAALLEEAAEDILAHKHFPDEHRRQLHSTNPLERLNKEIKRRSNVVGIFPNVRALVRLVGAVLLEQDDEWPVAERRYFSAESMARLTAPAEATSTPELLMAIA